MDTVFFTDLYRLNLGGLTWLWWFGFMLETIFDATPELYKKVLA
jgi:hypothetical protein